MGKILNTTAHDSGVLLLKSGLIWSFSIFKGY